jgi:hypothetical protein
MYHARRVKGMKEWQEMEGVCKGGEKRFYFKRNEEE